MRNREEKHKFKESKIGKIIYGFLMFAPLLAIGVTCGYAMFNKNAYQSYAEKITNTYLIDNTNSSLLEENQKYIFNGVKQPLGNQSTGWVVSYKFTFTNESVNLRDYFSTDYDIDGIGFATDGNYSTYFRPYFRDKNTQNWINPQLIYFDRVEAQKYINLRFEFTLNTFDVDFYKASNINYLVMTNGNLDNVFYYSVDKVEQSNLFNWSKTSNIYTGMHNFTTALNVTNTFIPMLLTYWLIISVIYFLYDIVLILLTILHRKIHNLQDSI